MTKDNQLEELQRRFQEHSRIAQAYYSVMHHVRAITGSDEAASAWMETGLAAFGGKSPSMLLSEGRQEDLLAHIDSLKP